MPLFSLRRGKVDLDHHVSAFLGVIGRGGPSGLAKTGVKGKSAKRKAAKTPAI